MKKQDLTVTPPEKKKTLEAFFEYYKLSSLLFDNRKDEVYNVTDIPKTSRFYSTARDIAKKLKVDWKTMSHEDSNRIMLAMLEESFNLIREIEKSESITLKTTIQIVKENE